MKRYQSIKLLGIAAAMIFAGNATAFLNLDEYIYWNHCDNSSG